MKKVALISFICFALSPPLLAEGKVNYSRCIPSAKVGLNPGEFTLTEAGKLAVDRKDGNLIKHNSSENAETAQRKMPGQSGVVKAVLDKKNSKPSELTEVYPAYDSPAPAYTVVTGFDYAGDDCFVSTVGLEYHDGEYKGRHFVQFDRSLCEDLNSAIGSPALKSGTQNQSSESDSGRSAQ